MIAYETKQQDREDFVQLLEVLSSALVLYQRKPTPELLQTITDLKDSYELLEKKINNHDYTEDEQKFKRITEHLDEAFGRVTINYEKRERRNISFIYWTWNYISSVSDNSRDK